MATGTDAAQQPQQFLGKTWVDRLESIAQVLATALPETEIIDFIIDLFWPAAKQPSIWSQIKDQVIAEIDEKVLQDEYQNIQSSLEDVRDAMRAYKALQDPTERSQYLHTWMVTANTVKNKIMSNPDDAIHRIPYLVALSHLDMAAQRELLLNGPTFYPKGDPNQWNIQFNARLSFYQTTLKDLFDGWQTWRQSQIKVETGAGVEANTAMMSFGDTFTNRSFTYNSDRAENRPANYFAPLAAVTMQMAMSVAIVKMASVLSSSFYLVRYTPGQEKANVSPMSPLGSVVVGPIGISTAGVSYEGTWQTSISDAEGYATSAQISAYNSIDSMQVLYDGHPGNVLGDPSSGTAFTLTPPKGTHLCGFSSRWANGVMIELAAGFSDGSVVDHGNAGGWKGPAIDARCGPGYYLAGVSYSPGTGPNGTKGIDLISFTYKHNSLREQS